MARSRVSEGSSPNSLRKDTMIGGSGVDIMFGMNGNDSLTGNGGSDALLGGPNVDTLYGGGWRESQCAQRCLDRIRRQHDRLCQHQQRGGDSGECRYDDRSGRHKSRPDGK
ncbi:calcium-binding protein [Bradyrhizobium liaoningense]|nr:calcium-binding protein [Bradyrhizobium liaoningense]MBR0858137.1 calcium-binding protein [Bradyrhizobium liaoningense]